MSEKTPFYAAKRPDKYYLLRFDPGAGDYQDVKFRRTKIVATRADHECCGCVDQHVIPAGRRAWRQSAIVDGRFGTCYADLECLDRWFDEVDRLEQPETPGTNPVQSKSESANHEES